MNSKVNVPEQIEFGKEGYSWRMDWKVNGWLFVATIISGLCDILFHRVTQQWPLGVRVGIVLVEFLAITLWAGSLTRWIRGMDEMHRRVTVSAVLFSVGTTFFIMMLWHSL